MTRKRIGVLTGGGDCSGLNPAVRMVVKKAVYTHGMEVLGFVDGFDGLVNRQYRLLDFASVSDVLDKGGTILGTSNRANPFAHRVEKPDGTVAVEDVSDEVVAYCRELGLEALIAIGGDGTHAMSSRFHAMGLPMVGVPKTIDNDLIGTDQTIGFATAIHRITEALDILKSTAESHHRIQILETMGRYAGWLALFGGAASGADVILIPELPYDLELVGQALRARSDRGKTFSLIVIAEGAKEKGGDMVVDKVVESSPDPIRLGGVGKVLASQLEDRLGMEARVTILGHLQRGGPPVADDRILAGRMAAHAVDLVAAGRYGRLAVWRDGKVDDIDLMVAGKGIKTVPEDHDLILAQRAIGISFGDQEV